jgi:hypothetical protein
MEATGVVLAGLLRAMGFTPTAAQIYARLIFGGAASPDQLRAATDSELFADGIRQLASRRMIAQGRDRSGPRIYAVDPGLSLTSMIAEVVWSTMTDLAPIDQLPETDNPKVEALRNLAAKALDICQATWSPADGIRGHRSTRASSSKQLSVLSAEAVLLGRRIIRTVSRRPRLPDVAFFWEAITSRMADGVAYRRITDLHELVEHGLGVVARDMRETGVQLAVIEDNRLDRGYYIIDRRYAVVFDVPKGSKPSAGGTLTADRHQISRKLGHFAELENDAIPGEFALAMLRERSKLLLDRGAALLSPEGQAWLLDVVEFGKFVEQPAPKEALDIVLDAGLVERNYTGRPVPVYGLTEIELRNAWTARPPDEH